MEHKRKPCDCNQPHCPLCDGGLFICTVCGAAEGELTKECPGVTMSDEQKQLSYAGKLNFVNGGWVHRNGEKP